eukprot:3270485-Pyramimonas_sp.AAC.1
MASSDATALENAILPSVTKQCFLTYGVCPGKDQFSSRAKEEVIAQFEARSKPGVSTEGGGERQGPGEAGGSSEEEEEEQEEDEEGEVRPSLLLLLLLLLLILLHLLLLVL